MNDTPSLPPLGIPVPLTVVAKRYGLKKTERLRKQAERGDFPEVFKISTKGYCVLLADLLAWEETRWIRPTEQISTPPGEIPPSLRRRKRA